MKTFPIVITAAMAVLCAQGAHAQATAPSNYLSLSGGPSHTSIDCAGTSACDDTSTAAKLLYGYRFTPNLAVEASVGTFGKVTASVPTTSGTIKASIKARSVGLGIAALLPFGGANEWTGIARLGIAQVHTTVDATLGNASGSNSENKSAAYAGLGLNYAFTPNFELGAAWDTSRISYSGEKATVNSYNLVGTIKF